MEGERSSIGWGTSKPVTQGVKCRQPPETPAAHPLPAVQPDEGPLRHGGGGDGGRRRGRGEGRADVGGGAAVAELWAEQQRPRWRGREGRGRRQRGR